jgi:Na+-transporting NADH:ubiquinone oxidoreductase subunit NqrC
MKMVYIVLMVMVVCLVMVCMIIAAKFEDLKRLKGQQKLFEYRNQLTCDRAGNRNSKNFRTSFFAVPTPTFEEKNFQILKQLK